MTVWRIVKHPIVAIKHMIVIVVFRIWCLMVLSFNRISSIFTLPVILLNCSGICTRLRHSIFLYGFLQPQNVSADTAFSLVPLLFIYKCQFKNAFHVFSKWQSHFYISFMYFLCFNLFLHTLSCRPNRFGWQIQLDTKLEGKIKLYICRGISNYHHSLIQNHEEHKTEIIIPLL